MDPKIYALIIVIIIMIIIIITILITITRTTIITMVLIIIIIIIVIIIKIIGVMSSSACTTSIYTKHRCIENSFMEKINNCQSLDLLLA